MRRTRLLPLPRPHSLLRPVALAMLALLALLAMLATACARAPEPTLEPTPAERTRLHAELAEMLRNAAAAWNRGDLDAFMDDYLPGQRTTFVTTQGVMRGTEEIRRRYLPRFTGAVPRDSLSFRRLDTDWLAPGVAYLSAEYVLMRGDSVTAAGPTSLVLVKRDGRWRIVHDHSS